MRAASLASPGKRNGVRGVEEPPTPGTSKAITSRSLSSARTKGMTSSKLAPMPLKISRGAIFPMPGRTAVRMVWPSRSIVRNTKGKDMRAGPMNENTGWDRPDHSQNKPDRPLGRSAGWASGTSRCRGQWCAGRSRSTFVYVGSRCRLARRELFAAQFARRFLAGAGAFGQPLLPVQPPGVGVLGRTCLPVFRLARQFRVGHVATLGVARRVEDALDMPAVGQDELALAAEQVGRLVACLPGGDVVGGAGEAEYVAGDLLEVDRRATDFQGAGTDQRVGLEHVDELAVQCGGQARGVVVPVEDVEHRRFIAEQVVVDPVVPDQVVGAHPGEHL